MKEHPPLNMHSSGHLVFALIASCLALCIDGAVLTEPPIVGDVPFSPEVYFDGAYRPICFANLNGGVVSVGDAVCLAAGFNGDARVVQNKYKAYKRDAMPVNCHECCLFCALLGTGKIEGVGRGYDCIVNSLVSTSCIFTNN